MFDIVDLIMWLLIIIVCVVGISLIVSIVDYATQTELESVYFECTISHVDISEGQYYIGTDGEISKILKVTEDIGSTVQAGDTVTIVRSGYHSIIFGDCFEYEVAG